MGRAVIAGLLAELVRRGIKLYARGNRLRYCPRSAMTPDLAERLKACKPQLLAILRSNDFALGGGGTSVAASHDGGDQSQDNRPREPSNHEVVPLAEQSTIPCPHRPRVRSRSGRGEGFVPDGWTRGSWRRRLLQLAEACQDVNPLQAAEYRRRAAALEAT